MAIMNLCCDVGSVLDQRSGGDLAYRLHLLHRRPRGAPRQARPRLSDTQRHGQTLFTPADELSPL